MATEWSEKSQGFLIQWNPMRTTSGLASGRPLSTAQPMNVIDNWGFRWLNMCIVPLVTIKLVLKFSTNFEDPQNVLTFFWLMHWSTFPSGFEFRRFRPSPQPQQDELYGFSVDKVINRWTIISIWEWSTSEMDGKRKKWSARIQTGPPRLEGELAFGWRATGQL